MKIVLEDLFEESDLRKQILLLDNGSQLSLGRAGGGCTIFLPIKGINGFRDKKRKEAENLLAGISRHHADLGMDERGVYLEHMAIHGITRVNEDSFQGKKYFEKNIPYDISFGTYHFRLTMTD